MKDNLEKAPRHDIFEKIKKELGTELFASMRK